MESGYQTVVDPSTILWTMSAVGIHAVLAAVQAALAAYLLVSGMRGFSRERARGAIRLGLGVMLVLPILVGASFLVSLVACVTAIVLLGRPGGAGRRTRGAVIGFAALAAAFMVWEREDALALGVAIATNAMEWRGHESEWQTTTDRRAPKVGDLAPDFELQDPSGNVAVRLSDFRGRRPVALVFGSYT